MDLGQQGPAGEAARSRRVEVSLGHRDAMRFVTVVGVGGVFAAFALAAIGGLPFDLPMPTHVVGWVEPSCGLTRGSTAIARGDLATAWHYNPLSFAVMGFGVFAVVRAIVGWSTGCWLNVRLRPTRAMWVALGLGLVAFWLYQQQHADFIINSRA